MSQELSAWLRAQRRARGWDVPQMARQLARATGDQRGALPSKDCLLTYIRRWERGTVGVSERYRLLICTAFGIPLAHFGQDQPAVPLPADTDSSGDPAELAIPGTAPAGAASHNVDLPGPPTRLRRYRDDESHQRPADLAEQMIAAAEESQDFGEWADTSNVGDATMEHYTAQVRGLARDYVHAPPLPLFLEAKRLRDRVFTELQGHQRLDQTGDLYVVAAQACGMLAWMSGDLAFQRAAQTHAWTAWVCAEQAGHDGARAWVRATQSKLAYWDGRYIESAQLATDGLRYACRGSVHTLLASQMARAFARVGRRDDAEGALGRASTEREKASGDDEIGGAFGLSAAQYHYMAGSTHLWRNDPSQAISESALAIEIFSERPADQPHYGPEALTRIDQARAHLQGGDLGGAAAALRPVLDLLPDQRLELITQNLGIVRQELAASSLMTASMTRVLQEEIETYCRESIVNDLRG
jgi:transcriptional regulator with XRE-family HTH domain